MENIVIAAILVLATAYGVHSAIRHFRRHGGCCGGEGYRPRKKRLRGVRYRKTFRVEGMHCVNCKNRVEEAVNDLKGVVGSVNLKQGLLIVSYAEDVEDAQIKSRIERAGYRVRDIQ